MVNTTGKIIESLRDGDGLTSINEKIFIKELTAQYLVDELEKRLRPLIKDKSLAFKFHKSQYYKNDSHVVLHFANVSQKDLRSNRTAEHYASCRLYITIENFDENYMMKKGGLVVNCENHSMSLWDKSIKNLRKFRGDPEEVKDKITKYFRDVISKHFV